MPKNAWIVGRLFRCRYLSFVDIVANSTPTRRHCGLFDPCRARRRSSWLGSFRACALSPPRCVALVEGRSSWRPAQISVGAPRDGVLAKPLLVFARRSILDQRALAFERRGKVVSSCFHPAEDIRNVGHANLNPLQVPVFRQRKRRAGPAMVSAGATLVNGGYLKVRSLKYRARGSEAIGCVPL